MLNTRRYFFERVESIFAGYYIYDRTIGATENAAIARCDDVYQANIIVDALNAREKLINDLPPIYSQLPRQPV